MSERHNYVRVTFRNRVSVVSLVNVRRIDLGFELLRSSGSVGEAQLSLRYTDGSREVLAITLAENVPTEWRVHADEVIERWRPAFDLLQDELLRRDRLDLPLSMNPVELVLHLPLPTALKKVATHA